MTYRITNTTLFTKNLGEFTTQDYVAGITYADISPLYPQYSQTDWETIKAEIIAYVSLPLLKVEEVPGLISYTEDLGADHGSITLEFATQEDYINYVQAQEAKGPVHGIMIKFEELAETTSDDYDLIGNVLHGSIELEIGRYLVIKYAIDRGVIRTCVHETI